MRKNLVPDSFRFLIEELYTYKTYRRQVGQEGRKNTASNEFKQMDNRARGGREGYKQYYVNTGNCRE